MEISKHQRIRCCPVCGSDDASYVAYPARIEEQHLDDFAFASRKMPEFMHHRLLRCPTCAVLYASPALIPDFLANAYREAFYDSTEEAQYAAKTYARVLQSNAELLSDREVALDVGTGDGSFLQHLKDFGFKTVIGVEPSHWAIESSKDSVRDLIRPGMFTASEFERESMSLVTCFQTIEHIENPRSFCTDAHSLLRPGGSLLLISHDYESWLTRLAGERSPIFDIEHLQLFSHQSLGYLLTSCGFDSVRIGSIRNCYPLAYWIKLLPIAPRAKRGIMTIAKRLLFGKLPLSVNVGNLYAFGVKG
jgi:SAM-dependent methyltransferase